MRGAIAILLVTACGASTNVQPPDAPPMATGCVDESDCGGATPYCEPASHTCVECRFASHCSATGEVCKAYACAPATSCAELHSELPGLPTGSYSVRPETASLPLEVTCDMTTDGGGWTVVFNPVDLALDSLTLAYLADTQPFLAGATDALIAYRTSTQSALPGAARFAMPAEWRTTPPFDVPGNDLSVIVSIDGGPQSSGTLRYGYYNFASLCTDAWVTASNYGRICITGTTAPFFSHFSTGGGGTNLCSDSSMAYNAATCTADKRFTIAVR